ncbi:MAG: biofilm synthesis N-glycosyltransferase [Candidatus Saccharibacteria bacterium]|nr:biofilm synthesis N-glycosyltransferase [Candidatus Saccharibacteria bacterium]
MKRRDYPIVGLVASKNPVNALVLTVESLFKGGAIRVIVVNDGSDDASSVRIFKKVEKIGGEVIHLSKNVGKANALKEGFKRIPAHSVIIQTDDDSLSGDLQKPAEIIRSRRADIVDIRVEAARTKTLIGQEQEISYWLMNAFIKRVQDRLNARLWLSGCSLMYSHMAGMELIMRQAQTITEDTEGLFRARQKGFVVKYCADKSSAFMTMAPEDFKGLHKQWQRWATGNAQVMAIYGLGGGSTHIAIVNLFFWFYLLVWPAIPFILNGLVSTLFWWFVSSILIGIVAALRLNRGYLALVGIVFPIIGVLWTYHAVEGFWLAYRRTKQGQFNLTWISPKRTLTIDA